MHNNLDAVHQDLITILDQYTSWFMQVLKGVTYPMHEEFAAQIKQPHAFDEWCEDAQTISDDEGAQVIVQDLRDMHERLVQQASQMIEFGQKTTQLPQPDHFNALIGSYESFISALRHFEQEAFLKDDIYDPLTRLKTKEVMDEDLEREMDRLERRGIAFCIALVRIDRLSDIKKNYGVPAFETCLKHVSLLIKKGLRSFDDAYVLDDHTYVLSLKQADKVAGIAVMERLRQMLKQDNIVKIDGGKSLSMTVSSCIAEPVNGESILDLIQDLKSDVEKKIKAEGDRVMEHIEITPLQRFVREQGEDH